MTDPPTWWFISETTTGRKLKIVYVLYDGDAVLKTAFPANSQTERVYNDILREQT